MQRRIHKAAVIGAGVMGSAIAAHLANVGIQTYLLDIVPKELTESEKARGLTLEDAEVRNRLAARGVENAKKNMAFYDNDDAQRITVGNTTDHLSWLSEVDWIIEAVVENLQIKQQLFAELEKVWKPGTIVSTNTSGVSIHQMVEGRSKVFRKHFLGTHFFNPPRFMKLLEIIPHRDSAPEIIQFMTRFAEDVLGKGVVLAKDTPNFIANRIGTYGLMTVLHLMLEKGLGPEAVDELTGPVMGRPKSATFRTLDLVGIDTFVHVANNVYANVTDEAEKKVFEVPAFIKEMVAKGWIGRKAGQGFYKKVKTDAGTQYLVLDVPHLEYRPQQKFSSASLQAAKAAPGLKERIKALLWGKDEASQFVWEMTKRVLLYTASKLPEIADDIVAVDNAMKWGFNWQQGPFETWDAIGLVESVERMKAEGETIPEWVEKWISSGKTSFYEKTEAGLFYAALDGTSKPVPANPKRISLRALKEQNRVIRSNSGASLIDLGDDVALLEFHSPNNAIGADIVEMMNIAAEEVEKNWRGLVIANEGQNFCVGANLMLILMEAQDENWDMIELIVKQFQDVNMRLKYLRRPVVAAPHAQTLGGGAEVCFPAALVQAAAETYMGLVEVGVGLIPGGGGTKELLLRNLATVPQGAGVDLQPLVNRTFETIAMAKVATSAADAKKLGFLRPQDRISVNRDHQIHDAKQAVLELDARGYQPPVPPKIRVVGEPGAAVMKLGAYSMRMSGYISDHDMKIANKLADVLAGGKVPAGTEVTEQYLLDLEREAFLSLVGEPKSQERMQHLLVKGKPLRN